MTKEITSQIFKSLVITIIISAIGIFIYSLINRNPVNNVVGDNTQKTELIKANDSITVLKQRLLLAESRENIVPSNDSIVLEALKASKVSPTSIAMWKSIFAGTQRSIEMSDSFNNKITAILESQKNLLLTGSETEKAALQQKYDSQLSTLLASRISFSEVSKYRTLRGDIGFDSKLNITSDSVISEPFVTFGEKKLFLGLGRPEYSVVIGDKNPNIKQSNAYSATYKPKSRLQLGLGPVVLFDNKSLNIGAGVSVGKGIFRATFGYNLYNKQFK